MQLDDRRAGLSVPKRRRVAGVHQRAGEPLRHDIAERGQHGHGRLQFVHEEVEVEHRARGGIVVDRRGEHRPLEHEVVDVRGMQRITDASQVSQPTQLQHGVLPIARRERAGDRLRQISQPFGNERIERPRHDREEGIRIERGIETPSIQMHSPAAQQVEQKEPLRATSRRHQIEAIHRRDCTRLVSSPSPVPDPLLYSFHGRLLASDSELPGRGARSRRATPTSHSSSPRHTRNRTTRRRGTEPKARPATTARR